MRLLIFLLCIHQLFISNNSSSRLHSIQPIGNDEKVKLGQFPYIAQLELTTVENRLALCGGSLISRKWILTAGHCCRNKIKAKITLGAIRYKNDPSAPGSVEMHSEKLHVHPKAAHHRDSEHDICVIELPNEVELSKTIQVIPYANKTIGELDNQPGVVSGWGDTNGGSISNDLLYAEMKIERTRVCNAFFKHRYSHNIMCATGKKNGGTCKGDSGGPFTLKRNGKRDILVGITSFGSGDECTTGKPRAFVRISEFNDFIKSKTGVSPGK